MKKIRNTLTLAVLASFLVLGKKRSSPSSLAYASETGSAAENHAAAVYQPMRNKGKIGRILDWGLAKVENIRHGILVSDLINAFIAKCDHMFAIMYYSFEDMFLSYDELHKREMDRLRKFDDEFGDLVKLGNKIDRKCLFSRNVEDRSLCVDKGMEIHGKIQDLQSQRLKSADAIGRYKAMIDWCTSYKNWFC